MEVYIVAVGKVREQFILLGLEEYEKRLKRYIKLKIREADEERIPKNPAPGEIERVLLTEGRSLLKLLPREAYTVVLDREGRMLSSEELAAWLGELALRGYHRVAFVIGGTLGLSPEVKERAQATISFSRLTFPHQLVRLLLLEQLYRALKIQRGEPYHW